MDAREVKLLEEIDYINAEIKLHEDNVKALVALRRELSAEIYKIMEEGDDKSWY